MLKFLFSNNYEIVKMHFVQLIVLINVSYMMSINEWIILSLRTKPKKYFFLNSQFNFIFCSIVWKLLKVIAVFIFDYHFYIFESRSDFILLFLVLIYAFLFFAFSKYHYLFMLVSTPHFIPFSCILFNIFHVSNHMLTNKTYIIKLYRIYFYYQFKSVHVNVRFCLCKKKKTIPVGYFSEISILED